MKAVTRDRFGSPDILTVSDTERPTIPPGHLLVQVEAAGVNRGDALEMRGWPYLARLMGYGLARPRHPVLGTDIAGRVVAVSDGARVEPGQHVAVIGASGGVGTFTVQIARAYGAEVTGVAGDRNLDLVRSIGADHVVDYAIDDITNHTGRYDVIIDLVGNQPLRSLRRALTPTGTLVVVGGQNPQSITGMQRFATAAAVSPFTRQRLVPLFSKPNGADLDSLAELVNDGTLRPIVGRTFDLSDTAEAIRHIETGHGTGRTVVTT